MRPTHITALLVLLALVPLSACDSPRDWPEYDGMLGLRYDAGSEQAMLKLWAPCASEVTIQFFDARDANAPIGTPVGAEFDAKTGVWQTTVNTAMLGVDSLQGIFYEYRVDGTATLDPYALSMAASKGDTGKAAIVDMSRVQVSGFADIPGYAKREDAIIYEIHVRDFTADPAIEAELEGAPFGTFDAFHHKLAHIRELGATHVQLLPVMAYYYGDEMLRGEREMGWQPGDNNYNWGYDPHSHFAPEGMYATDPQDPQARVDELKRLIEAIHQAGMGVILDVVYNHHPHADILDALAPGYYYRGRNDSFAGTDVASERTMVRKLIVDSLVHWTREYKVDGYRFDLMGLMDQDTIAEGYAQVAALNPSTLFIGEGWRMYNGEEPLAMATQDWVVEQDFAAVFSDEIRDLIKSGYSNQGEPAFITRGKTSVRDLFENLAGRPQRIFATDDPGDAVQYIAAHDNLTLHDVISVATGLDPDTSQPEIHARIRLGNLLILTSQGIAFIHAGQEYGRSKRWRGELAPGDLQEGKLWDDAIAGPAGTVFIENSYDSPDSVNMVRWREFTTPGPAATTLAFTRGLVHLRRSTDAFRLGSATAVAQHMALVQSPDIRAEDVAIAYAVRASNGDTYIVAVNADDRQRSFRLSSPFDSDSLLDLSRAQVLVDRRSAGAQSIGRPEGVELLAKSVRLAPLTGTVIKLPGS